MLNKAAITFFIILLSLYSVFGQKVDIYSRIKPEHINVKASSEIQGSPVKAIADDSGMTFNFHQSHNLGHGMWVSDISTTPTQAHTNTKQGVVWVLFEFDNIEKDIDYIQIWNHNQNQHTKRGLNKVYIEYSSDGENWDLLKDSNNDYFVIPEAVGRKQEPASLSISINGISMKYLCITADRKYGNHYHDDDLETLRLAKEFHQNINYYGLSEVRFYKKDKASIAQLDKINNAKLIPTQGYVRTPSGAAREFEIKFPTTLYCEGKLTVSVDDKQSILNIPASPNGILSATGLFPTGYMDENKLAKINFQSRQGSFTYEVEVPRARKWKLYFLPHSHLDIGYTHRQNDVMDLQIRNFEWAIDLAERTKEYPEGAQYKWNSEATWCLKGYLDKYKGTKKEDIMIDAIQKGRIGVDATLGSILTGVSKQEEMMHYFDDAHYISELTGIKFNTAMMSDVPGQSWGLVTAMAQNGVKYFSSGPNYVPMLGKLGSHGVGLYNLKLGDVPFWWESQSGNERILYWQTGKGYSMFHGWLMDVLSVCGTDPIWDYLAELEEKEYPYGLTYLRYTIHGDNGPPDNQMPEVIKEWNERYESPKFVIGTTQELFTEMEELYGDKLPTLRGDMTPIWEDGAASTANELAINRASTERLNQSEILWSMNHHATLFPFDKFNEGWKYSILFSEHTWGASASGSAPESQFTKELWAGKKLYSDSADIISRELLASSLSQHALNDKEAPKQITVYNTNLWYRSDIVRIEGNCNLVDKALQSKSGEIIPVQKTHDGCWIFYAKNIAPLSSYSYKIVNDKKTNNHNHSLVSNYTMDNGRIKVTIDDKSGAIISLKTNGDDYEYTSDGGLNQYLYSGTDSSSVQNAGKINSITILDNGPIAATIGVESKAPGCNYLKRNVTIYRDIDRIDIVNEFDKTKVYEPENIRFKFPFNFDNPEVSMDLAMSEIHPEREQVISSNKNFYSVLNGLSVSDIERGIYLSTIDAPFIEMGNMTADLFRTIPNAKGWLNSATISPTIYSWVMNNRWRTNYKISQEGITTFRYSIQVCDPNSANLKRFGSEQAQKLIAITSDDYNDCESLFSIKDNKRITLSTMRPLPDGNGYIIRLQSTSPFAQNASLDWGLITPLATYYCDNMGNIQDEFDAHSFWLQPYDCITIKIITKH